MPSRRSTPKGYEHTRQLRNETTPAEKKRWAYLRGNKLMGVNFRRQHAIGPFITDFCAPRKKLVIELDGNHSPRLPQAAIGSSVTRVTEHLDEEDYDKTN
jgi:very-short-patch-repair endonuclease